MNRTERQKLGIKRWLQNKGIGTFVWATGVGKTRAGIMIIELLLRHNSEASVLICVPTKYLKEQWENQLIQNGLITNCVVEVINTTIKHKQTYDLLILDESHRAAADSLRKVFDMVTYDMLLCLTATIERLDGKEIIIKQHAPICDTITLEEAIKNQWVSPIKNYLVLIHVDLTKYKEYDKQFNSYFSFFDWNYNIAQSCLMDWKARNNYAKQIGSTPKNVMVMASGWMRALHNRKNFIDSHPKKIEVCRQILDARKSTKCITFCPTIKFAESIKRGVTLHSGKKESENKKIMEEFNKASTGVINSSKALNEGADIQGLTVGIKMNVNSSKITNIQTKGRICRFTPDKIAEMFTLVLADTQEVKWFNNSNDSNYIVIDTQEKLDKVLNFEDFETRKREFNEDIEFRF